MRIVGENGIAEADFRLLAGMKGDFGLGFEDHTRALQFLIGSGAVRNSDGYLRFGELGGQVWIKDLLGVSDPATWSFFDKSFKKKWKFDPDNHNVAETGLAGEIFVISELKKVIDSDLHDLIQHVAIDDDSLGFDISSPSVGDARGQVHLEVKATTRPGDLLNFFLSRNEYDVGCSVSNWFLVFVRMDKGQPVLMGHLSSSEILDRAPTENSELFRWQILKGQVDARDLMVGLP
jgi:hypothetical protein